MDDQQWLQRHFGCSMHDNGLLSRALSHRSVGDRNNERLEFLGDAVLGYLISDELYLRFPEADEGQLSRLRVSLVKGSALAAVAREIDLGDQLRLGAGELSGGGRQRNSILADALEALLGAIAQDQGIERCREVVSRLFGSRLSMLDPSRALKDAKTRLQEWLQARGRALPRYAVIESRGEEHQREFLVRCSLEDSALQAEADGSSRRRAEQQAAAELLAQLESDDL